MKEIGKLLHSVESGLSGHGTGIVTGVTADTRSSLAVGAIMTTVKAIQFLLPHLESLEARVAALESKTR